VTAFIAGMIFAVGLGLAGMTDPGKVIAFLDLAGDWSPRLALVMGSAVTVTLIAYRLILRRRCSLSGEPFHVPPHQPIRPPLVAGAVLFGIGWGLSGLCPGPAVVALVTGRPEVWIFVGAMVAGIALQRRMAHPRALPVAETADG